jgi:hypothetical protein
MASHVLFNLAIILSGWAVFFPRSFGKEMRSTFDKIADGWNSKGPGS